MIQRFHVQAVRPTTGFTIVELLTVVAIIGILAAILIPTAGSARNSARKARTRVQFSQWAAAFEAFRLEYGEYPQLSAGGEPMLVNQGASPDAAGVHPFHDLLAGARRDGSPAGENPLVQVGSSGNFRQIRFFTFAESDFVRPADVAEGRSEAREVNLLRDGFHNTSIAVVTDANLDGLINGRDAPAGFPAVAVPGSTAVIRPTSAVTTSHNGGIHAGVIFYSAPSGAVTEDDLIMSWK